MATDPWRLQRFQDGGRACEKVKAEENGEWKRVAGGGVCRKNADAFSTFHQAAQSLEFSSFPGFRSVLFFYTARDSWNRHPTRLAYTFRNCRRFFSSFLPFSGIFVFCRGFLALKPWRDAASRAVFHEKKKGKSDRRSLNGLVDVNNDNGLARLGNRHARRQAKKKKKKKGTVYRDRRWRLAEGKPRHASQPLRVANGVA